MGILAWIVLLAAAAAIATAAQALVGSRDRGATDHDWVYIAGGGLIGGFTGHAWYASGPTFDGLYVLPAAVGLVVGAVVLGFVYRLVLRPRQG